MKGDKRMYKIGMTGVLLIALGACNMERPIETRIKENPSTFCNPLNLDYRFMKIDGGNGIREAADPVVTHFKDSIFICIQIIRLLVFFGFQFLDTCRRA